MYYYVTFVCRRCVTIRSFETLGELSMVRRLNVILPLISIDPSAGDQHFHKSYDMRHRPQLL